MRHRDATVVLQDGRQAVGQHGCVRAVRHGQNCQMHPAWLPFAYQGKCRLSHRSAGPINGRSCQPCAITCARIDSAAPRSVWRITVAYRSLARRCKKWTQLMQILTSG
jgi:hypothetical protein